MATLLWFGRAAATADVWTATVGGTVEAGDKFLLTVGGKSLSVSATTTSPSTTATEIATAWNALGSGLYPEFALATAEAAGSTVVLTADEEGVPFTVSASTTESNGGAADAQTFSVTNTTPATGPNFWSNINNWSTGALPANGDTVYVQGVDVPIKYGLDQSAVTLAALYIDADFTGSIGLPEENTDGGASYYEYRDQYLKIGATSLVVGRGQAGQGSGLLRINTGSAQTDLLVYLTAASSVQDAPAFWWKGTHASNAVSLFRGDLGVAVRGGEAATVSALKVGYETGETTDSTLKVGSGTTLTTLTMQGGTVELGCAATTVHKNGGTLTCIGSGAYTTLNNWQGEVVYRSSGTLTNLFTSGRVDYSRDMRAKTVTNATLYRGGEINDPQGVVVWTNGIDLSGCGLREAGLDVGRNITLTPSAI